MTKRPQGVQKREPARGGWELVTTPFSRSILWNAGILVWNVLIKRSEEHGVTTREVRQTCLTFTWEKLAMVPSKHPMVVSDPGATPFIRFGFGPLLEGE